MNEHDAMKLPEGKTCFNCHHFDRCSRMFGAHPRRTECDFYPRRFIERPLPNVQREEPSEGKR